MNTLTRRESFASLNLTNVNTIVQEINQNAGFLNDPSRKETTNEAHEDFVSDDESSSDENCSDNDLSKTADKAEADVEDNVTDDEDDDAFNSIVESVDSAFQDKGDFI